MRPVIRRPFSSKTLDQPSVFLISTQMSSLLFVLPLIVGIKRTMPNFFIGVFTPATFPTTLLKSIFDVVHPSVTESCIPSDSILIDDLPLDSYPETFGILLDRIFTTCRLSKFQVTPDFSFELQIPFTYTKLFRDVYGDAECLILDSFSDPSILSDIFSELSNASCKILTLDSDMHLMDSQSIADFDIREKWSFLASSSYAIVNRLDYLLIRAFIRKPVLGVCIEIDRDYLAKIAGPIIHCDHPPAFSTFFPLLLGTSNKRKRWSVSSNISFSFTTIIDLGVRFKIFPDSGCPSNILSLNTSPLKPTNVQITIGCPLDFSIAINYDLTNIGVWVDPDLEDQLQELHKCLFLDKLLIFSDDNVDYILELIPQAEVYPLSKILDLISILYIVLTELSENNEDILLFVIPQTFGDSYLCRGIVRALNEQYKLPVHVMTKESCGPFFLGDNHVSRLIPYPSYELRPSANIKGFVPLSRKYFAVFTPSELFQCTKDYLQDLIQRKEQFALDYALQCGLAKEDIQFEKLPSFPCKVPDRYILIQSTSRVSSKEWSYFPELVTILQQQFPDVSIVQVGGPGDPVVTNTVSMLGLSWLEVSYIVENTLLYIGVDSIIAHMSAVYDKPCIVLYGGTDVNVSRAIGSQVHLLYPEYPISDGKFTCYQACHQVCYQSLKCIDTITTTQVVQLARPYLEKERKDE